MKSGISNTSIDPLVKIENHSKEIRQTFVIIVKNKR